jgi:cyclopropane-fatty-acyl-phospholipid synthase
MQLAIDLAEQGRLPDLLVRFGIRRLVAGRLRAERSGSPSERAERTRVRLAALRRSAVALSTDRANEQHYDVPAAFFRVVLGRNLKYSAGLWDERVRSLDEAEMRMLELYGVRAAIADGQKILDLGCGWGSFALWAAQRFRDVRITAVSNAASQRAFIEGEASRRGLDNITVVTADVNLLDFPPERFDRVVSIEMFEHMRNYEELLRRIGRWLKPDGKLFVHIFCHRQYVYPYQSEGSHNWIGRYFFTDGLMPAADTLAHFQSDLRLDAQWRLSGMHYANTARAWLERLDARRVEVRNALSAVYGDDVETWVQRWRLFFMACEEMFGYRGGREWQLGHYLLSRR